MLEQSITGYKMCFGIVYINIAVRTTCYIDYYYIINNRKTAKINVKRLLSLYDCVKAT